MFRHIQNIFANDWILSDIQIDRELQLVYRLCIPANFFRVKYFVMTGIFGKFPATS